MIWGPGLRPHKYFTQIPKSPSRVITVARARSRKALPTRTYAAFLRALSCRHVRSGSSSSRLAPGRNYHSVSPCDCCLQEPCIVWLFICLVGTSHTHCCVSQQTMFNLNKASLFTNEMSCIHIMNHLYSRRIDELDNYVTTLIRSPTHICVGLHDCVHAWHRINQTW